MTDSSSNEVYLITNAFDQLAAPITHHSRMSCLVEIKLDLTGADDMCKTMTLVLSLRLRKALFAEIVVWAFKALVASTADSFLADITGR